MSTDSDELAQGTLIANRYRIVRKLGAGGMGAVYEALQEGLGRKVALKVLLAAFAQNPEVVARFQREAQAAASLGHPNIVSVTDFGADAGQVFLVMEYLAGASLAQVIERERVLSPGRAAWIATQVLSALSVAHGAGIVHRDMKPDNVFLTEVSGVRDVVKVLDFGIARFTEQHGSNSKLTSTGAVLGTPAYMSPEQARGRPVDARTDVYSAGVMLYEMLTGRLPFQATNYHALLFAILEETPPSIASLRGDVPPALVAVVERAMSRDINTRFQSADELRAALAPFSQQGSSSTDAYAATAAIPQVAMMTANTIAAPSQPGAPQTGVLGGAPQPSQQQSQPWLLSQQPSVPKTAPMSVVTPTPMQAYAPTQAPPSRSWLPWAAASVFALVSLGGGLALVRRSDRAANRAAVLEAQRAGWIAQQSALQQAQSAQRSTAIDTDGSASTGAIAAPPLDSAVTQSRVPRARGRGRGPNSGASSGGETAVNNPFTAPAIVAPGGRRPVRTSLSGGTFHRASRVEVGRQLAPLMGRIEACANLAIVPPGEGVHDGWGMDFDLTLDPSSGRVLRVEPRGDTTRAKPGMVGCIRRTLLGQPAVPNGDAPSEITVSFTNRYVH
jgi:serine/threonine protein kinase